MPMENGHLMGSCLCGGVRYEIVGDVGALFYCHCTMCRKAHGAAFAPLLEVSHPSFRFTHGEELIKEYRSSDDVGRTFCGRCGSNLQFKRDAQPGFLFAIGTLDTVLDRKPTNQIWAESKAPWHPIQSDIPSYKTYPSEE